MQQTAVLALQVNLMTSFNSASFPDSLAIAKESGLTIGSIDEIQKLHIRAVPMGEQARRLAHQDSSHTFLVTTASEPSGTPCHQSLCTLHSTLYTLHPTLYTEPQPKPHSERHTMPWT